MFQPAKPNFFLQDFFARLNPLIFSRDVTWIVEEEELDRWRNIPKGAPLFIAAKHAHHADEYAIFELARRAGRRVLFVSIPEVFERCLGIAGFFVRRLGGFSVERGGRNVHAARYIIDLFLRGESPVVIFAEGELHFLNDVVTPLKQGTAFFALEGAKARAQAGKTEPFFVLPVCLKYMYPHDIAPMLNKRLSKLEKKFFGRSRSGETLPRINELMEGILSRLQERFKLSLHEKSVEERFRELSLRLVEKLETDQYGKLSEGDLSDRARKLITRFKQQNGKCEIARYALHSLSFWPGYLNRPTQDRLMETLRKSERMITLDETPPFPGPHLLFIGIEEPIRIDSYLSLYMQPKGKQEAMSRFLADLRTSMQKGVDRLCAKGENFLHEKILKAGVS